VNYTVVEGEPFKVVLRAFANPDSVQYKWNDQYVSILSLSLSLLPKVKYDLRTFADLDFVQYQGKLRYVLVSK